LSSAYPSRRPAVARRRPHHLTDVSTRIAIRRLDSATVRDTVTEHLPVVRHLIESRAGHRLGDGNLAHVAERIETLIAEGRGGEGLTATVG
jgi:hypothetical protein